nr:sigma-70 family RNA polymerase sigma factor [Mucilaginibacter sp. L294]
MARASLNDDELWRNIVAGDNESFAIIYDRYWLRMYKAALHYLRDVYASEEVVQEVFLIIWNKRQTLDIKNFAAYLNSSTRYEVYRRLKASKNAFLEFHEGKTACAVVYNEGYEKLNEADNNNLLDDCLKDLPKRCREIFYLSKFRQLSNTEIAEQLGINKHTVENQLAIAIKHLKINFSRIAILVLLLIKIS